MDKENILKLINWLDKYADCPYVVLDLDKRGECNENCIECWKKALGVDE